MLTAVFSVVRLWGQVCTHKQMFKQRTHNSGPWLNGSWMRYCSCHSSHVMSASHRAETLGKLLRLPHTLQTADVQEGGVKSPRHHVHFPPGFSFFYLLNASAHCVTTHTHRHIHSGISHEEMDAHVLWDHLFILDTSLRTQ